MRKIIFFNPYADNNVKGASRRIEFLSNSLRQSGVHVDVILKNEYFSGSLSKIECLAIRFGMQRLSFFFAAYRLAREVGAVVISEVIFIPTWKKNIILTIHDLKAFNEQATRGGIFRMGSYKLFARLASKIIVVSEAVKRDVIRFCDVKSEKVYVNYNGLSRERIKIAMSSQKVEKCYDFIYVSSFARHKRHAMLVSAAPAGARLCFVGRDLGSLDDVNLEIELRNGEITVDIYDDICTDQDLFALISSAKCGIFPSVFEGFGIPLLEYVASGLYVMASDIAVFREISEYVDYFFQPDNLTALSKAMVSFMHERPQSKASARLLRDGKFSEEAVTQSFLEIINTISY